MIFLQEGFGDGKKGMAKLESGSAAEVLTYQNSITNLILQVNSCDSFAEFPQICTIYGDNLMGASFLYPNQACW